MTQIPDDAWSPYWPDDDRTRPPATGGEREVLTGLLDYHRRTLELKCAGLGAEQLSRRSVPPSTMSLHGLVRHLAGVERWWFRTQLAGERDLPPVWPMDEDPDADFNDLAGDPAEALARWREECAVSRRIVAESPLDRTGTRLRDGEPFTLRWLLAYLVAEYARHNGHADLLREAVDGRTGA